MGRGIFSMLVGPLSQQYVFLVVAGGDYLQALKVAMNILNKQSWTADKERSSSSAAG